MTEKQSSGELFVNGDFATGDFTGWMHGSDEYMSVVPQEGRRVAVLKPVPYDTRIHLQQLVVRERSDGDYVVGFWLRTSDEHGNAVPGVTRRAFVHFWVHPRDHLGDGVLYPFYAVATSSWTKHTWQFSITGRRNQDFEITFQNERKAPAGAPAAPAGREGYQTVIVPEAGGGAGALNDEPDVDDCPFAIRDVTLFKA